MHLTTSSILNVSVLSGMAVLFLWFILKSQRVINHLTFGFLLGCLAVLFIRIALPVEYGFTVTIPETHILPIIRRALYTTIGSLSGYEIKIIHILYLVWILGSIITAFFTLKGFISLKRAVKNGTITSDQDIQDALTAALEKHKRKKQFKLVQADAIETPMIFGIRKPCIFLPQITLSKEEWQYILEHEITHYYHGDLYIKYLLSFFTILYWWNPFVHILNRQVAKVLELHTDHSVIASMDETERLGYAECLLQMSKQCLKKKQKTDALAISYIGFKKFSISQRFYFVTAEQQQKKKKPGSSLVILPILAFTIFSFCFIFEACYMKPEDAQNTVELSPENAYLIHNAEGGYDIYYNNEFFGTSASGDIGVDLPIYNLEEEVP